MSCRTIASTLLLALFATVFIQMAQAQMTVVNGASFNPTAPVAPGSFAAMFGSNLCGQTATATGMAPGQLPTTLGNCSVSVNGMPAMMQYASPGQINFVLPQNTGPGPATITVNNGSQTTTGSMMISQAAPGMFATNNMGMGEGAMMHGTMWQAGPFSTTTNGQPTPVSIYATGLDLSSTPMVSIGGMPAGMMWFGSAPGYPGVQQINISLPPEAAGAGRVPVTITSNGQTSNVTFMHILPTTSMMQGMPGWGSGMMIGENTRRGREVSYLAFSPANNSALVTDENDDVVRMISLDSNATTTTITLPSDSQANGIAVNAASTLAAVTLSAKASVVLIDLSQKQVIATIGTGNYPSHAAFSGTNLLVTNSASGTVSIIDTNTRTLSREVTVGFGPSGIAATPNVGVVVNTQAGTLSIINLSTYSVSNVTLPAGSRPYEVAISTTANKALVTAPTSNRLLILDLSTNAVIPVETGSPNAIGPGAVVASGNLAFVANQMTASISVVDLASAKILNTFSVDPGPRALAVNPSKNQLLVLTEGTGTLDIVDLSSYSIVARLNAADTERQGNWFLPLISSLTPNTAAIGSSFTLTIAGTNLQPVKNISFEITGFAGGMGGGMGGGGMMGGGSAGEDANIKVSNIQVKADGTQITASVQILSSATAGTRLIRLETDRGEVSGMMMYGSLSTSLFTVTSK